jgi:hypothetical protein
MSLDAARFQKLLDSFDLTSLFIEELGWDRAVLNPQKIAPGGEAEGNFILTQLAQKRGVSVFLCSPDKDGNIPDRKDMLKIEREAAKISLEHLLIFGDRDNSALVWFWVSRVPGEPVRQRSHPWRKGQSGESLRQKLGRIVWSLDQEEAITLTDVITGLRGAFDRDRVSKTFYDHFKRQHDDFARFIEGLKETAAREWYASLTLNRLMFVYFIQKKGFLDGDENYLVNRLRYVKENLGKGKFHSFYRAFLRKLFHDGLGMPVSERSPEITVLLGDIPYLNGGLFAIHEIEETNSNIDVPDEAFEKLFEFFDKWEWHLDNRPLRNDKEINPDVLGYIFEKYINQKQMGAYYTKEDITGYISKYTVIPHLLETARTRCKVAFEGEASVWNLLREDPDRYIYPAMKTGVVDANGEIVPETNLPDFVQKGMRDAKARMFDKNYNLKEAEFVTATGERGTLPTETWREYAERRNRCLEIRAKLKNGKIRQIDDLITLNLDICQFAQDIITNADGPHLLRAFWQAIAGRVPEKSNEKFHRGITVLDPTCGSGAFLFAALNILEPLYEACLDRMEGFIDDAAKLGRPAEADFVKILGEANTHPSRSYYIYKSIILNNLFGVDIMLDAVEICKLRLFLKLVSQVDRAKDLEPLPDIDFNIRAGNTLVGYATEEQFNSVIKGNWADEGMINEIKAQIADLADMFDRFREQQTIFGGKVTTQDKRGLKDKLNRLSREMDKYLATDSYRIDMSDENAFASWRSSHQPFHWFAEFYGVMREGGFNVVIGNPPFVENTPKNIHYSLNRQEYKTFTCGNLYAFVSERCFKICSKNSCFSFIMPSASCCTPRMSPLFGDIASRFPSIVISIWDERPSKLFDNVDQQLCIFVCQSKKIQNKPFIITSMRHWSSLERQNLFSTLHFNEVNRGILEAEVVPKIQNFMELSILEKIHSIHGKDEVVHDFAPIYYRNAGGRYWRLIKSFPTFFKSENETTTSTSTEKIRYVNARDVKIIVGLYSSSTFYWYWRVASNCRHLTDREFDSFPIKPTALTKSQREKIENLSNYYEEDVKKNSFRLVTRNRRSGLIEQDSFKVSMSKKIIDEIDKQIQETFKLTDEELDFIINYDIKYRMGNTDDYE